MKERYQELGSFIGQSAKYIYVAITLFSAGILIGYIDPDTFKGLLQAFGKMAKGLLHENVYGLTFSIFIKNGISALISILLGAILGIVPSLAAITNGILLGATISSITKPNAAIEMLRLLPHGIFELPAIFISWGVGIWNGLWYFQKGPSNYSFEELRNMSLRTYFNIILPLLLVAAIIESLGITAESMF